MKNFCAFVKYRTERLEPVQSLQGQSIKKARWTNCKLVLNSRSQFLHSLQHAYTVLVRLTPLAPIGYTVLHLGNSLGKKRHWQPVRNRYSTAQNTSNRSTVAGLVLRLTLRSSGSIWANFWGLMSLGYFFVFTLGLSVANGS